MKNVGACFIIAVLVLLFAGAMAQSQQSTLEADLAEVNAEIEDLEWAEKLWTRVVKDPEIVFLTPGLDAEQISLKNLMRKTWIKKLLNQGKIWVATEEPTRELLEDMRMFWQREGFTEDAEDFIATMMKDSIILKKRLRDELLPEIHAEIDEKRKHRDNLASFLGGTEEGFRIVKAHHPDCDASTEKPEAKDVTITWAGNPVFPVKVYSEKEPGYEPFPEYNCPLRNSQALLIDSEYVDLEKKQLVWKEADFCKRCWYYGQRPKLETFIVKRLVWLVDDEGNETEKVKLYFKCKIPKKESASTGR
jgi:hypothetical protein